MPAPSASTWSPCTGPGWRMLLADVKFSDVTQS
jgi:hypothetical protein